MYADSLYHKYLRVSGLSVAFVLAFQAGLFSPETTALSLQTHTYVANVIGITAGVAPTEVNTLTAELTKRQRELDEREMALAEREIDARATEPYVSIEVSNYILSGILFLLLVLIVTNYALDFVRARKRVNEEYEAIA